MPFDFQQYQGKAEVPPSSLPPIPGFESAFHQPWSEPVRFKVVPRLAIALIASGLFAPVLNPSTQITQFFESRWHQPWSEPVRVKPRLITGAQQFHSTFFDILPKPANQIQGWFQHLREPVWPKKGLRSYLQQTLAYHPRILPPANVTLRLATTETNLDVAQFGIDVFTSPPVPIDLTAVEVSITEIVDGNNANASIKEDG